MPGDSIVAVNSTHITSAEECLAALVPSIGGSLTLDVQRDNQVLTLSGQMTLQDFAMSDYPLSLAFPIEPVLTTSHGTLLTGDRVIEIAGQAVTHPIEIVRAIELNLPASTTVVVERNSARKTVVIEEPEYHLIASWGWTPATVQQRVASRGFDLSAIWMAIDDLGMLQKGIIAFAVQWCSPFTPGDRSHALLSLKRVLLLRPFPASVGAWWRLVLTFGVWIGLFNLLPIKSMDGYGYLRIKIQNLRTERNKLRCQMVLDGISIVLLGLIAFAVLRFIAALGVLGIVWIAMIALLIALQRKK